MPSSPYLKTCCHCGRDATSPQQVWTLSCASLKLKYYLYRHATNAIYTLVLCSGRLVAPFPHLGGCSSPDRLRTVCDVFNTILRALPPAPAADVVAGREQVDVQALQVVYRSVKQLRDRLADVIAIRRAALALAAHSLLSAYQRQDGTGVTAAAVPADTAVGTVNAVIDHLSPSLLSIEEPATYASNTEKVKVEDVIDLVLKRLWAASQPSTEKGAPTAGAESDKPLPWIQPIFAVFNAALLSLVKGTMTLSASASDEPFIHAGALCVRAGQPRVSRRSLGVGGALELSI